MKIVENKKIKENKIAAFDPNAAALDNGHLFGLPFGFEESALVVLPVPWELTVSYGSGTSKGPEAILRASTQVDLYDPDLPDFWKYGIYMLEISDKWQLEGRRMKPLISEIHRLREKGLNDSPLIQRVLSEANQLSHELEEWVIGQCERLIHHGKMVALLGGDHSVSLGLMKALANHYGDYAILQIDAHADLREAFEGFEQSHASIMYNALKIEHVKKLVQVGIRDFCHAEAALVEKNQERIHPFTDRAIKRRRLAGDTWSDLVEEMVELLPHNVYLSFDIDGLDPKYCPHTGTPVPGGLEWEEIFFLIGKVVSSGRKIIGFDLVEVSPGEDEWDANVGARTLMRLSVAMFLSNPDLAKSYLP